MSRDRDHGLLRPHQLDALVGLERDRRRGRSRRVAHPHLHLLQNLPEDDVTPINVGDGDDVIGAPQRQRQRRPASIETSNDRLSSLPEKRLRGELVSVSIDLSRHLLGLARSIFSSVVTIFVGRICQILRFNKLQY